MLARQYNITPIASLELIGIDFEVNHSTFLLKHYVADLGFCMCYGADVAVPPTLYVPFRLNFACLTIAAARGSCCSRNEGIWMPCWDLSYSLLPSVGSCREATAR